MLPASTSTTVTNAINTAGNVASTRGSNQNVSAPPAGTTVGAAPVWNDKQIAAANYWQYGPQYNNQYYGQYYPNNTNGISSSGAAVNYQAQLYQYQQYQQQQQQHQIRNKNQEKRQHPMSLLGSQKLLQQQAQQILAEQKKRQKQVSPKEQQSKQTQPKYNPPVSQTQVSHANHSSNQSISSGSNRNRATVAKENNEKCMNQELLLSPLLSPTDNLNCYFSEFTKIMMQHIELLLIWDDNDKDKHIGFRLTGCTCSYLDQVSGKSLVGFVYRPSTLDKFCDFLPVFYIHLRDDKCPNVRPKTLYKSLTDTFPARNTGYNNVKDFCVKYFNALGICDVPGQGLRVVNPAILQPVQQDPPLPVQEDPPLPVDQDAIDIDVDDDEEVQCMSAAVISALEEKPAEPEPIPEPQPEPTPPPNLLGILSPFSLPLSQQTLITPETPGLIVKLIQSVHFHQPLPPKKLICRCSYCHDNDSGLQINSLAELPYDLHHYFLYHHIDTCGEIPGVELRNLKCKRPVLFSKEYYNNRDSLKMYLDKVVPTIELEDAEDGGLYCKIGGPGSRVEDLEVVDILVMENKKN